MSIVESRRGFLDERRTACRQSFDTLYAPGYDEHWGALPASHRRWLGEFAAGLSAGAEVLDAACGTGRAWGPLLDAGLRVTGLDQSAGMLAVAAAKYPAVPTMVAGLQELAGMSDLHAAFDGLACLDAMEYIGPEDWPVVLAGFAAVLRPGGRAYLTVELPDPAEAAAIGAPAADGSPVVAGELYDGVGYHYSPAGSDVRRWLAGAGFATRGSEEADGYWHLLLSRGLPQAGDPR